MINSDPTDPEQSEAQAAAVEDIMRSGMPGAIVLAGLSTAVVIGMWFAFYLLVFLPRAPGH